MLACCFGPFETWDDGDWVRPPPRKTEVSYVRAVKAAEFFADPIAEENINNLCRVRRVLEEEQYQAEKRLELGHPLLVDEARRNIKMTRWQMRWIAGKLRDFSSHRRVARVLAAVYEGGKHRRRLWGRDKSLAVQLERDNAIWDYRKELIWAPTLAAMAKEQEEDPKEILRIYERPIPWQRKTHQVIYN